ncbi:hypothetical protein CABS01_07822 [Colletotrichum abscissum]|uniref:Uncharacterized protein n=1 Tax=Colletotrichum tamarilloi TaxID=1209934 RepID=A0ABQ9QR28_9PEZI|nr:uncharacterized protein CTAM01_13818 [Colletotrichum tamarilloi]XP_060402684.1 uncharacterized protein CABS01_07822 [Colletotrichum abscissum]KAI3539437.1 hypothetical protein CSPX01_08883 [Colletotrichum filicis]KAK1481883.1 hypothetical protein CTAM01_13818 [Colletotrichum tamarilloi]KAK1510150.1 hypothetical protein CABS01_07822 [Colletotrichum abscissum]
MAALRSHLVALLVVIGFARCLQTQTSAKIQSQIEANENDQKALNTIHARAWLICSRDHRHSVGLFYHPDHLRSYGASFEYQALFDMEQTAMGCYNLIRTRIHPLACLQAIHRRILA